MRKIINKLSDRLFPVLGALLFLQLPHFIQQYHHQLIGHFNELQWQNEQIDKVAFKNGKTSDEYIKKFLENDDKEFALQGKMMEQSKKRLEKLSKAHFRLQNSTILSRPFVFLAFLQIDIFLSTLHHFAPGMSLTFEAFCYGLLGIFFGWMALEVVKKFAFLGRKVL